MENNDRVKNFLDQATAGLGDDRELQLDVRAELAAHIEDAAAAEKQRGTDEHTAQSTALQQVGDSMELADDITAGNKRRMRRRARVRLAMRVLLIPAVIVITVLSLPFKDAEYINYGKQIGGSNWFGIALPRFGFGGPRLSDDEKLILHGDQTAPNAVAAQRAIWEAHPDNVMYFNNYLTTLFADADRHDPAEAERVLNACRKGSELEPENARYDYVRAMVLLEGAAELKELSDKDQKRNERTQKYRMAVKDRERLDRTMAALKAGSEKPYYRRYAREMLQKRLEILGPPRSRLERIRRVSMAAGALLPDLSGFRNMLRCTPPYARLLIDDEEESEARAILETWAPATKHLTEDSFTLIDVLVCSALAVLAEERVAPIYDRLGLTAMAEETRSRASRTAEPVESYKEQGTDDQTNELLKTRASVFASMLMPALRGDRVVKPEQFRPGRLLDYLQIERLMTLYLSLALVAAMLCAGLVALRWRFTPGGRSLPILLMVDPWRLLRILLAGIVLPMLGYYLLTRFFPPAERAFALGYGPVPFILQTLLLFGVIGRLAFLGAADACVERCATLELAVPKPTWPSLGTILLGVLGFLGVGVVLLFALTPNSPTVAVLTCAWLAGAAVLIWKRREPVLTRRCERRRHPKIFWIIGGMLLLASLISGDWYHEHTGATVVAVSLAAFWAGSVLLAAPLMQFCRALSGSREYGLYYGTVARSLIPLLAAVALLFNAISQPYFRSAEKQLVRENSIMSIPSEGGFTVVETKIVNDLRTQMLAAMKQSKN